LPPAAGRARRARTAVGGPVEAGGLHHGGNCRPPGLRAAHGRAQTAAHPRALGVPGGVVMGETPSATSDFPSPSVAQRVDEACGRFEAAWRAGDRPALEPFLEGGPESERPRLLRELV